jgi:hypothetical protein
MRFVFCSRHRGGGRRVCEPRANRAGLRKSVTDSGDADSYWSELLDDDAEGLGASPVRGRWRDADRIPKIRLSHPTAPAADAAGPSAGADDASWGSSISDAFTRYYCIEDE